MILNPQTVLYGFLNLLALGAALAAIIVWMRAGRRERLGGESLALMMLLGHALLVLRLFSWFTLYWLLGSYISLIPGAMCIYGVARTARGLTLSLEALEPATLLLAGGAALALSMLRTGSPGADARRPIVHLVLASAVAGVTALLALGFIMYPKGSQEVSCCSAVFSESPASAGDEGFRVAPLQARLILGGAQSAALSLFFVQLWALADPDRRGVKVPLLGLLGGAHGLLSVAALFAALAPVLTGMPGHHCAYCLGNPRYYPAALARTGLLALGLASFIPIWTAWALLLDREAGFRGVRSWIAMSVTALITYWTLVMIPYLRASA